VRNVGLILSRELGSYVRTPSGYFIAAAVLLLDGLLFNGFAVGDPGERRLSGDVLHYFFYLAGIVTMIGGVVFSMRLLAEDRWTHTDVLLFTSPIREGEVVLGKYLAALTFITVVTLMSLYIPALILVNGKISWGHIAAGYLGVILLGASTLAIGMFASSLTSNPFFAVILSAVFVVLLDPISYLIGQKTDPPWGEIISYAAMHTKHHYGFQRGLVQLSDFVFFGTIIYASLLGATKVLQSRRWR
jgi:ABC-2 type transport system permease protein